MSTWMICYYAGILILFATCLAVFLHRHSFQSALSIATAGVALSTASLVFPHYSANEGIPAGLLDSFLVSMKIFILNDSYSSVLNGAKSNLEGSTILVYSILVSMIYLIAPLLAATFLLQYLSSIFSRWKVFFGKGKDLYLFSDLNSKSITLAASIRARDGKTRPLLVFTGISREKTTELSGLISRAKEEHMLCVSQRSEKLKLSPVRYRTLSFFQISPDEDENLTSSLSLLERYRSEKKPNISLYVHSSQTEAELLLDATEKGCLVTSIIHEGRINACHLLDSIPLYRADLGKNNRLSILLVGCGYYGMELLKAFVWCGQMDGIELEINVIDKEADLYRRRFSFECPGLLDGEYRIHFLAADVLNEEFKAVLREKCGESNYICVALGDDELNIRTALFLRRHYLSEDPVFRNWPVIAMMVRSSSKFQAVNRLKAGGGRGSGCDLIPFGCTEELYSCSSMVDSCLENLARNIHAAYESMRKDILEKDEILRSYNRFEIHKRSNLAQALHIRYKLWSLGLDYEPCGKDELPGRELQLSPGEMDRLVRLEHRRWNAFQLKEGWIRARMDQVEAYEKTGLSEGHRHFIAKMHPCICPYEELGTLCQRLDPDFIRYDRNYIEKLAEILGDKWGITGVRYRIIKRE